MRSLLMLSVVLTMVACALAPAFAHDGSFGSSGSPIEFSNLGTQSFVHTGEQFPWKGTAFVYVKNTGTTAWGDFHFQIYSWNSDDISNVSFTDASMGGMDPVSTQSPLTWSIDNVSVGAKLDLYFYGDPVLPGQVATFQIYTDNTADQVQFGLMMHPTPVPEPSSLALVLSSCLGLAGMTWRRRK